MSGNYEITTPEAAMDAYLRRQAMQASRRTPGVNYRGNGKPTVGVPAADLISLLDRLKAAEATVLELGGQVERVKVVRDIWQDGGYPMEPQYAARRISMAMGEDF